MSNASLTLGKVTFSIDEMPEHIEFGGTHSVAVRKYAGGFLDIQRLGAFDDTIGWDGTLWFENALSRCQQLDAMRVSGEQVTLTMGTFWVPVVVVRFKWTYENDYRIGYHIELQPARRLSAVDSENQKPLLNITSGPTVATAAQQAKTPTQSANDALVKVNTLLEFGSAATTLVGNIVSTLSPPRTHTSPFTLSQALHIVGEGETLWSIAMQHYGNGNQWAKIANANVGKVTNPNALVTGEKLVIPNPTKQDK